MRSAGARESDGSPVGVAPGPLAGPLAVLCVPSTGVGDDGGGKCRDDRTTFGPRPAAAAPAPFAVARLLLELSRRGISPDRNLLAALIAAGTPVS